MSYFKAKVHQIRFLLELRCRPRWGSLKPPPDRPLAGFNIKYCSQRALWKGEGGEGKERDKERGTGGV